MARVLIVDDEKSIRRTLAEFLRVEGHVVSEAADAEAALKCVQEGRLDVVVSDIVMPQVNGVELLRRLRSIDPGIQVVIMTGEPTVETASEALRAGAMDYLSKPITKPAIVRVVANAARIKALADEKVRLEAENRAYQENLERLVEERTRQLQLELDARMRAERHARRDADRTELLLQLHQQAGQMTDRALFDYVLEKAVHLTESTIGFFHQISEDQETVTLTTWNQEALKGCTAAFETHYPLREAGAWAGCIRTKEPVMCNDFAGAPGERGLPEGHNPVRRFMSIPVTQDGLVRIIFGVGNKAEDYDAGDLAQLQLVANELYKLMVHRAAEHQVRQLSRAVEQSPSMIVITDRQGAIEYVNPKFTQATGYTLEEVRGQNPRILKSGTTPASHYRHLWETLLAGREWRGEFHNRKKNGEVCWEFASISPITDPLGNVTHFVAVKDDITDRKRMEAFRQVLLSLGSTLNQTRDPVSAGRALLAAAGQLWQWDSASLDILEPGANRYRTLVAADTFDNQRRELPHSDQTFELTPRMQRIMKSGAELLLREATPVTASDTLPFGNTSRLSASIIVVPIRREDRTVGILSVQSYKPQAYAQEDLRTLQAIADFCGGTLDRIWSEDALRRSEERYRGLVESTPDWIWELDRDGRYTFVSQRITQVLGYEPGELIGKTPFDFMSEAEAERIRTAFVQVVDRRSSFSALENVCRHKQGHEVVLETSGVPILGPSGEFLGYRGMDRDISERKRLEAQFRQAQKLEAIGQLAGGVAHDFNNILAAILMQLGLLHLNTALDEDSRHALKELETGARRAANLTRQLLMFSRRSVLSVRPVNLNELTANLLKMLGRLIGEHINLRLEGAASLAAVEADAGMLEQVLMNLVVNARDAMPRGGDITISTNPVHLDARQASSNPDRREGNFVCLAVADSGCGMDPQTLRRIFEPFFTTKEPGKGTGLGLATVYGIVAQHKGWVEVASEVGRGTTFTVMLPALPETSPLPAPTHTETPLRRGHETVLIVEDEQRVRQGASRLLRILGYRTHEAEHGIQALELWPSIGSQVDLVLTDMVMPGGMNGLELVEQLQATKPGLKAIICSGYSADIVHAGLRGKVGITYLPKPFETHQLANSVRACLDTK